MPYLDFEIISDTLTVTQSGPYGRGFLWPQSFKVRLIGESTSDVEVKMSGKVTRIPLQETVSYIYDDASLEWALKNWFRIKDDTCRQSQLMNLNEGFQHGKIEEDAWIMSLLEGLLMEKNALIASTICSYISRPLNETDETYAEETIEVQRERISNPDRKRQFDFISRATTPDSVEQESLFLSLLDAENRRIEPWDLKALGYLCHPLREQQAVKYIGKALENLPNIQRTSDIFFPMNWSWILLKDIYSSESLKEVKDFLEENEGLHELLKSKVLQASWDLQRRCCQND